MEPEKPNFLAYIKAALLVGLSSYPYFVFVQSVRSLPLQSLVPCSDTSCSYTRLFRSSGIESTGFDWVGVQNGIHDLSLGIHDLSQSNNTQMPALCPDKTIEQMRTICEDPHTRNSIRSSLKFGTSGLACAAFLFLWANLMIAHDWFLMLGFSETVTISVRYGSGLCLTCAAGASFLFAMTANEVFMSDVSNLSTDRCGCYYKMPPLPALFTVVTPMLLWYTSFCTGSASAMINGDCLFAMKFNVPYLLVRQTQGWSSGMLVPKVAGSFVAPQSRAESPAMYSTFATLQKLGMFPELCATWSIAFASFGVFPKYMEFLLTEAVNLAGGGILLHLFVRALAHGPFALGLVDSLLRFASLRSFSGSRGLRLLCGLVAFLGLDASFSLMPPWVAIGVPHSPSLDQLHQWGFSSVVIVILLKMRWGILNQLFGGENNEIIILARSGLHIPAVKSRNACRPIIVGRVGEVLQCPQRFLDYATHNPITASRHLEKEVQDATQFLNDHPSYSSITDRKKWQEYQAERLLIRPLMEADSDPDFHA